MKGHAIIGFNHGVLGLAENPALGPGFFRQNTSQINIKIKVLSVSHSMGLAAPGYVEHQLSMLLGLVG